MCPVVLAYQVYRAEGADPTPRLAIDLVRTRRGGPLQPRGAAGTGGSVPAS